MNKSDSIAAGDVFLKSAVGWWGQESLTGLLFKINAARTLG